jgi:hypothetical protein
MAGRIRSIEKSSYLIGNRTRDFPACSMSQWNSMDDKVTLLLSVIDTVLSCFHGLAMCFVTKRRSSSDNCTDYIGHFAVLVAEIV